MNLDSHLSTASLHTSWVLYWLGTNFNASSSLPTAFLYIHLGMYLTGTNSINRCSSSRPCWTFLGCCTYEEHNSMHISILQQVFHTSLGFYTDQEHISIQMTIFRQLFQISLRCYTDQEGRNKYPCIWHPF